MLFDNALTIPLILLVVGLAFMAAFWLISRNYIKVSPNTVAVFMTPCCKRTQRPSFRSIAGMMSTRCCGEA